MFFNTGQQKLIRLFSKQPPSWQRRSDSTGANVDLEIMADTRPERRFTHIIVSRPMFLTLPLN
ncbi:hypothetical protein ACLK1T_21770 [Escherichia coli]